MRLICWDFYKKILRSEIGRFSFKRGFKFFTLRKNQKGKLMFLIEKKVGLILGQRLLRSEEFYRLVKMRWRVFFVASYSFVNR